MLKLTIFYVMSYFYVVYVAFLCGFLCRYCVYLCRLCRIPVRVFMPFFIYVVLIINFIYLILMSYFFFSDQVKFSFLTVTKDALAVKLKFLPNFLKEGPTVVATECVPNQEASDLHIVGFNSLIDNIFFQL